jgi:hypothetical protein
VLDLLPSEISSPLRGIRGNGNLQLYARITGRANSTQNPKVEADFRTSNANLSWDRFPFRIQNLNLAGSYSNGGAFSPVTTSLQIQELSAVIGEDHLSGRGSIINFYDPSFSLKLEGDIHPGQWLEWYDSIPLESASGQLVSDLEVHGSYNRDMPRGQRFLSLDITGGVQLEDVGLEISRRTLPFSSIQGSLLIDNDFWEPDISGSYGDNDFSLTGSGLNLMSYLLNGEKELIASVGFTSGKLDLQEVFDAMPGSGGEDRKELSFPGQLDLRLEFVIDELIKEHFNAENVRGVATYRSPVLSVDSLVMQTMEGTLRGGFQVMQDHSGMITTHVNARMHNLDIHELFYAFNNFGQEQITHEHLKGILSGSSLFSAEFDPDFSILTQSILSENKLVIHDGELNNFSPLKSLSRFIEVDELQNVQFETLENNILIRENQVVIPVMEIRSNALDLSASGNHGFDNHYDYRLKLQLSELLYNEAKKSRNREFEIARDESDTRTLFLKISDTGTGSTVEIDHEKTAAKIRDDLKDEGQELKQVLRKEWGLFKKDSLTEVKARGSGEEPVFMFEFQEDSAAGQGTTGEEHREKNRRWWRIRSKKDTLENKPAKEFVIDETLL